MDQRDDLEAAATAALDAGLETGILEEPDSEEVASHAGCASPVAGTGLAEGRSCQVARTFQEGAACLLRGQEPRRCLCFVPRTAAPLVMRPERSQPSSRM